MSNMELIKSSAIKYWPKDSTHIHILGGKRHADILEFMFKHKIRYVKHSMKQGFFTTENRFVDRYEAAEIAYNAGQIDDPNIKELFSEDIWPEE